MIGLREKRLQGEYRSLIHAAVASWRENLSYKTLTGQTGRLKLYSGGVLVAEYPEVKIIYSSSDTASLIFKTRVDGDARKLYWQGEALFEFE